MKGLSPLIASVLLIAFTVSVAMIIMTWFTSFARGTTENISATGETAVGCSSAGISIEHIYISGTNGVIVVRNIGFVPLDVTGMIVNTTGGACSTASATTVGVGETKALSLSGCQGIQSNCSGFSRAIVSTNCAGIGDEVKSTRYVTCS